jgi:hypothetical protein
MYTAALGRRTARGGLRPLFHDVAERDHDGFVGKTAREACVSGRDAAAADDTDPECSAWVFLLKARAEGAADVWMLESIIPQTGQRIPHPAISGSR